MGGGGGAKCVSLGSRPALDRTIEEEEKSFALRRIYAKNSFVCCPNYTDVFNSSR